MKMSAHFLVVLMLFGMGLADQVLTQEPVPCREDYTVQRGDWLSKIAERYLGDILAYPVLAKANNAVSGDLYAEIVNPDSIEPGWILCIPGDEDMAGLMAVSNPTPPPGLAPTDLMNATVRGIYAEPVTLSAGTWEGEPFVEGGASRPVLTLLGTPFVYQDVTGDGRADAFVTLAENSGGSGTFTYLALVVDQNGRPVSLATALLGDRTRVDAITVGGSEIVVETTEAGPNDPMCCPGRRAIKTFELQGNQLVERSSHVLEAQEEAPDLVGTVWRWKETLMSNDDVFAPAGSGGYTVQFSAAGTVSVQADCNQISGRYTLEGNRLSIELGTSTMAQCPEGSLGDRFTANLGGANSYFFDGDDLLMELMYDSGTMRFSAQGNEFAGSAWTVIGNDNSGSGVVGTIIGTELTAAFGPDGGVTGSAGCNSYRAGMRPTATPSPWASPPRLEWPETRRKASWNRRGPFSRP